MNKIVIFLAKFSPVIVCGVASISILLYFSLSNDTSLGVSDHLFWFTIAFLLPISGALINVPFIYLFETPSDLPDDVFEAQTKSFDSTALIGEPEKRYNQLIHKEWDWCSFYNGWIEGRAALLKELKK